MGSKKKKQHNLHAVQGPLDPPTDPAALQRKGSNKWWALLSTIIKEKKYSRLCAYGGRNKIVRVTTRTGADGIRLLLHYKEREAISEHYCQQSSKKRNKAGSALTVAAIGLFVSPPVPVPTAFRSCCITKKGKATAL
jgi:hypothetical protein